MESKKENNKNIKELLKELCVEWSLSSTSHGWPNVFRSKRYYMKIMWLICLLVSTGLCIFVITESVNKYLKYEVVTKVRVLIEKPIEFPSITICNLDPFITKSGHDFILDYFNQKYNQTFTTFTDIVDSQVNYDLDFENLRQIVASPDFDDNKRKSFGYKIDEMIIDCYFMNSYCNLEEFEWVYYPTLGNCFKFNSGYNKTGEKIPIKKVSQTGIAFGLNLEIFTGHQRNHSLYSYQTSSGLKVFIHNQTILPTLNEGIEIETGKCTNIKLSKIFTINKNKPYSDCDDLTGFKSNIFNHIKQSKYSYRYKDCLDLCYQMSTISKCGCYDVDYPKYLDAKPCFLDPDNYSCLVDNYHEFISMENNENCSLECPFECESQTYDLYTSYSEYPSYSYAEILKQNKILNEIFEPNDVTYNDLKETLACLKIYYNELKYTVISEEEKVSSSDLAGNIGGTLGLFIGISLLSLIEVVELIIESLVIIFTCRSLK